MRETRSWEQMRRDNIGAAWINKDGNFCEEYKRTSTPEVMEMLSRENLPEWKKPGFNGCWSCDRCIECHFKKSSPTQNCFSR